MSISLDIGRRCPGGVQAQDLDAAGHGILARQVYRAAALGGYEERSDGNERERGPPAGGGEDNADHGGPSILARMLPRASLASIIVPGFAAAGSRRIPPPSTLTMA
jgi:hypothetical protein